MKILVFIFCLAHGVLLSQESTYAWQDFTIGSPALSLRLPGAPVPQSVDLPQSLLDYIKRYDAYYLQDESKGMVITVSHVTYKDEVTADIRGATEGTIGQWKATGATVEVKSTLTGSVSGRPGMQTKGTFNLDGKENIFALMVITQGSKMWQVSIIIKANDSGLSQVMQTIIESLKFNE